jgi:hypothetical protein
LSASTIRDIGKFPPDILDSSLETGRTLAARFDIRDPPTSPS